MDKRLPLLSSLLGVILLAASLAYWILQLYQPAGRPIVAAPHSAMPDPPIDAAATLFGGEISTASASSYQLTGIVAAGRDSVAIIVAEGSPPKALRVGKELAAGITLAEVHPRYVMLSDGGVMKRLDLAADTKAAAPMAGPGGQGSAAAMPANLAPGAAVPEPPMAPGAVPQQQVQQQIQRQVPPQPLPQPAEVSQQTQAFPDPGNPGQVSGPPEEAPPATPNVAVPNNPNNANNPNNPAPAPVQMPPPTRATGSPVGGQNPSTR
jgi:general secretion pathway protein C